LFWKFYATWPDLCSWGGVAYDNMMSKKESQISENERE